MLKVILEDQFSKIDFSKMEFLTTIKRKKSENKNQSFFYFNLNFNQKIRKETQWIY